MSKKETVYVVVTTVNDGERDLISDVVLITGDKGKAEELKKGLEDHTINFKLDWLGEYEGVAIFTREIDNYLL